MIVQIKDGAAAWLLKEMLAWFALDCRRYAERPNDATARDRVMNRAEVIAALEDPLSAIELKPAPPMPAPMADEMARDFAAPATPGDREMATLGWPPKCAHDVLLSEPCAECAVAPEPDDVVNARAAAERAAAG